MRPLEKRLRVKKVLKVLLLELPAVLHACRAFLLDVSQGNLDQMSGGLRAYFQ